MLARRFLTLARVLGTIPALRTSVRWLVRPHYVVAVTDLSRPLPPVPTDVEVRLMPLRAEEVREALAIDPRLTEAAIHRRRATGEECLLVWHAGVATHCVWCTDRPVYLPYLGRRFRPLPGDRVCVDVASRPAWRRRGIDTAASISYLHTSRDLGYRRAISLVASWNAPALNVALRRMYGEAAGTIGYWNLGLARCYRVSGTVCVDPGGDVYVTPP
jgi:hypothetical protein